MKRTVGYLLLVLCIIAGIWLGNIYAAAQEDPGSVSAPDTSTICNDFQIFEPFLSIESIVQSAQLCSSGTLQDLFYDGFEAGLDNWQTALEVGTQDPWTISTEFPFPPSTHSLRGADLPSTSFTCKEMIAPVAIPVNAFMNFQHAHDFEFFSDDPAFVEYFDGGVVEFSTDGGTTWNDCGALFTANGYNATGDNTISNSSGNPIGGRNAFAGFSLYKSSTMTLSSLSGKNVRFRFCIGTDGSNDFGSPLGWFIDEARIYRCVPSTTTVKPTTTIIPPPPTTSVRPSSTTTVPVTTVPTTTSIVPPPTTSSSTITSSISVSTSIQPTTTTSIGKQCPFVAIAGGDMGSINVMRQFRDTVLNKTPVGRHYVRLFYAHSIELSQIIMNNPLIAAHAKATVDSLKTDIKSAAQGKTVTIREAELHKISSVLNEISSKASPELARAIMQVKHALSQEKILGTMGIKVSLQ